MINSYSWHACSHWLHYHDILPYLSNCTGTDISSLTANERGDLQQQLETNLEEIVTHFANYTDSVQVSLQEMNVSVKTLRTFLLGLPAFIERCDDQRLNLLASKRKQFEEASDLCDIFIILKTECSSFLNYRIFERLIKKFNIDRNDTLMYPEKLKEYVEKHKISEFNEIQPYLCDLTDDTKELILVLDIKSTCTLARLTDLGKAVAKIMGLKQSALRIHSIMECCIIVTFLIPAAIANHIFCRNDVLNHHQVKQLKGLLIKKLECNGFTFDAASKFDETDSGFFLNSSECV